MADEVGGLLGFLKSPEGQGLLSAAFGTMAGAQRGTPWNNFGRGGLAGIMGYGNALDRQMQQQQIDAQTGTRKMQDQIVQMQLEQARRDAEKQKYLESAAQGAYSAPKPSAPAFNANSEIAALTGVDTGIAGRTLPAQPGQPAKFDMQKYLDSVSSRYPLEAFKLQQDIAKADEVSLPEGATIVSRSTGKPKFVGAPKSSDAIRQYEYAVSNGYQGSFADWVKESKSASTQPYYQFIGTPEGIAVGNARSGQLTIGNIAGKPVMKASDDPALQGNIAGAKERAQLGEKSTQDKKNAVSRADMLLSQLDQAEQLLKKNPTGSYIGAGIDAAGRAVGYSSESAQTASRLEALSGWLVSNVPRMEGPQSNFDVENYRTMAGKVGNRTLPIAERMAALDEVRRLQQKYRQLNLDLIGGEKPNKDKTVVRTGMYGGKRVVQYSDGSVSYAD